MTVYYKEACNDTNIWIDAVSISPWSLASQGTQ
jgi:hypothetical protein